jgi:hypothetical protein
MTDAIGAITSSTSLNQELSYEQISPEDLAKFENEFNGVEIQFPSINSIDETDFSDKLLHHFMEIDKGYQQTISNKIKPFPVINNTISESIAFQDENIKLEQFDFSNPTTNSFESMIKSVHEANNHLIDTQAWSLQLQMILTTSSMMAQSVGSILKGG